MRAKPEHREVSYKVVGGRLAVAFSADAEISLESMDDEQRASAFEDFANIETPAELLDVFERLASPPVFPEIIWDDVNDVDDPKLILDAFGIKPTRTNIGKVEKLLMHHGFQADCYYVLDLSDCLMMIRDMKALLTVLMFSYRKCDVRALELNTRNDFAFLHDLGDESMYNVFLGNVREDEPDAMIVDYMYIHEDIDKALKAYNGRPKRSTLSSMQKFAEHYVNGFMWATHPAIKNQTFYHESNGRGLGHIYAYWAEAIAKGRTIACPHCGKLKAKARKNQIYCSKNCVVRACQEKNK